jgi:N-6 DNA Methylase
MSAPNWSEIKTRAIAFAKEWADEPSERAEAQSFWNDFFQIFGVPRRRVAVYEAAVKKLNKNTGRIDCFWPGKLLIEHKSKGQNLDAAHLQALDYFAGLNDDELPQFVLVSDFENFQLYDLDDNTHHVFKLADLHKNIDRFKFFLGQHQPKIREQDPINQRAVEKMGKLHDALKKDGYTGEQLEILLVRLLFCLFADDTGIFSPRDMMLDHLINDTKEDGSDFGMVLGKIFETLNKPHESRQKSISDSFNAYPYVNGKLFEQHIALPSFTKTMRDLLLDCCELDWSKISPAIFGAMFQKIIELDEKSRRREMGAHYTSEENILKLINSLFLDDLKAEFEQVKHHKNTLFEFHKKLTNLKFLDPACGCGNFLVITYRELRLLELEVLKASSQFGANIEHVFKAISVNVDQFSGIEFEEFPAQIAQVAMWLIDHQMNIATGELLGEWFARIPLTKSANIRKGDALRIDWEAFCPPSKLNYIIGNPPFIGKSNQTAAQKEGMEFVTKGIKNAGVLDYVAGWYIKAAQYVSGSKIGSVSRDKTLFSDAEFSTLGKPTEDIFVYVQVADEAARRKVKVGFVSTNSITQGEQVGVLWSYLLAQGMSISFAHRTFQWTNDAPGKAAVHCVIIGFGRELPSPSIPLPAGEGSQFPSTFGRGARGEGDNADKKKQLFEYPDIKGQPHEIAASNINPYLVDAPDILLQNRSKPICNVPEMVYGNKPVDGGNLLLSADEKNVLLAKEPNAAKWLRPVLGAEEFLNAKERWCLWLVGIAPSELKAMPEVLKRVEGVRKMRLASVDPQAQKLATRSTEFRDIKEPETYILVPSVSSEKRSIVPIGFFDKQTICTNLNFMLPNATLYHFGILTSTMHNAWMRQVCGRLESRYRYSNTIVYNNFPWPTSLVGAQFIAPDLAPEGRDESRPYKNIETAAQAVLDARAQFPHESLANLYGATMPPALVKAHAALDKAVDAAYVADGGSKNYASDAERVAFLFKRYQALTSLI